jgi:2-polyprenyl-3-methyl-5-hydroxy-6-metoxy-1,4-benzoquinol methylase
MLTQNLKTVISEYLSWSPLSLVIREACRINSFTEMLGQLPPQATLKVLDVGCGDGHWWKYLKQEAPMEVVGIDINPSEVAIAQRTIRAEVVDITDPTAVNQLEKDFELVIGNCSLEHIPNINQALRHINSLTRPEGKFVLYVPTPYWALRGKSITWMEKISPRLPMAFSGLMNGFFQHWHLYHHEIWTHLLSNNGFQVEQIKGLGSSRLEFLFRLFLPSSFIAFLCKALTGKYLNFWVSWLLPKRLRDQIAEKISTLVKSSITDPEDEAAFEYMIIARKTS